MLSVNATMDAIVKRLGIKQTAYREIYEKQRSEDVLVLGASCIELDRESLGRLIVKQIKSFHYHNRPERVGFVTGSVYNGVKCDISEVLIVCTWNK